MSTAIESGVSWVDLEVDISASERKSLMEKALGKTKIIASYHSEEHPPPASEIVAEVGRLFESG